MARPSMEETLRGYILTAVQSGVTVPIESAVPAQRKWLRKHGVPDNTMWRWLKIYPKVLLELREQGHIANVSNGLKKDSIAPVIPATPPVYQPNPDFVAQGILNLTNTHTGRIYRPVRLSLIQFLLELLDEKEFEVYLDMLSELVKNYRGILSNPTKYRKAFQALPPDDLARIREYYEHQWAAFESALKEADRQWEQEDKQKEMEEEL